MKPDFETITIKQLKKYILEHREDREAWDIFMTRIDKQPINKLYNEGDVKRFPEIFKQDHTSKEN